MGVGLWLGLDAIPLRQLVLLERFWVGLVANRLWADGLGFWQRICHQHHSAPAQLPPADSTDTQVRHAAFHTCWAPGSGAGPCSSSLAGTSFDRPRPGGAATTDRQHI